MKVLLTHMPGEEEQVLIERYWPGEVERIYCNSNELDSIAADLPHVEAIIGTLTEEMLERIPNLKLYHVTGHGVDGVVFRRGFAPKLRDRGIVVAKAQPMTIAISELAIMEMIALSRRTFTFHEALAFRGDQMQALRKQRMMGSIGGELNNSTLGIIGFGAIGKAIAARAIGFGMTIGAVARRPERIDKVRHQVAFTATLDSLETFLPRCHYVVLCIPATDETFEFMNHERFAAMRDGSYLVNVARGSLIQEEALFDALQSGKLAGAGLDVWQTDANKPRDEHTPWYPFSRPIHHFNVIMTPHYAGSTLETRARTHETIGENLRRLAAGEPLLNVADLEAGY